MQDEEGTEWKSLRCTSCGTHFLHPSPTDEQLARAYSDEYYGGGETKFGGPMERIRDWTAQRRARILAARLPPNASILDVGCGDGRLLRQFQRLGHSSLFGVELPGKAANRARTVPGIQLHEGSLASARYEDASFDLITLVHVLEHLPHPDQTLAELARICRPGGFILLAFPNIESWQAKWSGTHWFHLDPPRHLNLVPPSAVIARMRQLGFYIIAEDHLCLEQNTYGWLQSVLNGCSSQRNLLFEVLKKNRRIRQAARKTTIHKHAIAAGMMTPPALLLDFVAATVRRGATVDLILQNKN